MVKAIQVNLHRARAAQALLQATAAHEEAEVLLVSEPNHTLGEGWYADQRGDAAVVVLAPRLVVGEVFCGRGFVRVCLGNAGIVEFNDDLTEVERSLRMRAGREAVVGGDFNAKSHLWSAGCEDERGRVVAEFAAVCDLVVCNRGSDPTVARGSSKSVIDVTMSTPGLASRVMGWCVMPDETLSDHRYIWYELAECGAAAERAATTGGGAPRR